MSFTNIMRSELAPLPIPSTETEPFWAAVQERRLVMPRCDGCRKVSFPPVAGCPDCGDKAFTWSTLSGRGKVFSFVVVHRAYHPAFKSKVPYVVAVIELEEGPRIISNIVGLPVVEIQCEMAVAVVFERVRDGFIIPRFARR